jgi:hypothetical protein
MQFRLTVLACFVVGTAFTVSAQSPVWWTERQVLTNDTSSDDFAVLNIGQLKNTAARAADEFRYRLPQGAGPEVSALIASWEPWLQGTDRDDFAVANIGQLKAVTQPFYQQLMDAGVVTSLPWADNDPARDDFAAANIGQLKAVFAFDLDADSDGDWMRDVDEKRAGTNPLVADAHLDDDSDGYSNWQEMLADTPAQSTLATGWQRAWSPVVWNPVSQATTAVESGLGSTLSALGSESGGASQEVLLRAGGFRFLVTDSASFRAGFATSSLVLTSPGWAVAADVDGANQLRVVVNDVVGDVVARIRSGDVLTLSRDEGQFRIWLNRVQIHSMTASNAPQRLVPNAHLRSQNMALLRCQSYGLELDEDGDGIADAWELEWIASRPSSSTITTILAFTPTADFDGDGVSNLLEFLYGLNPWSSDSDGDGTPDGVNVFAVDADGDGIPAHIETAWGLSDSDPSDAWQDLDGDGLSNWVEYTNLLANPAYVHDHPDDLIDTDGDGMTDVYEIHYGLNPLSFLDATHDNDGDGVMNFEEAAFALDPFDSQTRRDGPSDFAVAVLPFLAEEASSHRKLYGDWDQDGVPDWREHLANQMARARALDLDQPPPDVLLDLRTSDVMTDLDGDGILTMTELANGTNPLLVDTDGDGLSDLLDPDPGTIEAGYSAYLTVFWAEAQRSFIHQHLAKKGLMLLSMNSRGPHIKLEDWGDGWFRPQIPVPPYTSPDQPAFAGYFQAGPRDAVSWFLTEVNKAMAGYTPAVGTFWKSEMLQGASESHYFISSDYVETSRSDLRLFHIHPVHANLPQAQVGLWSVAMQMDPNVGPSPFQNPTSIAGQWSSMVSAGRSIAQATAIPAAVTVKDGPETLTTSRLQLSNSLLVWEEVPPLVVLIPGQGNLSQGFPGLHPGNAALYRAPLTTRVGPSTNPTPPTVTVTAKGAGQVRLWAIEHKGNPTMENRVALPISNSLLTTDLLPLFVGLDLRAVTFWIEPLQPGPVTLTYLAKARHNAAQITRSFSLNVALLPVELAPEVLAVNADFDEGDTTESHAAKPDFANGTLKAKRDHLDGKWQEGDIVTDDLHTGFFGLRPGTLPYTETAGAVVKIKKLDKNDPETNRKQSGHVRLYAVWGSHGSESEMKIELYDKDSLVANDIGPQLYHQNPNTPVTFYLEGVEPGKITLEFSYQKGATNFTHEQEFLVATTKSRAQWREEVVYQIRLQNSTDPPNPYSDITKINPALGYRQPNPANDNSILIALMYYYYAQLFNEHQEKFLWPGMARVAAASIYAGMSDMYLWNTNPFTGSEPGAVAFVNDFMIPGAQAIFNDLAWSHRAYAASGIYAIKHLDETEQESLDFQAWKDLDDGIANEDMAKIRDAGGALLDREQNVVIQPYYAAIGPVKFKPPGVNYFGVVWIGGVEVARDADGKCDIGEWMSANSTVNPILDMGGDNDPLAFRTVVPGGRLDNAGDRWAWITHPEYGMLPRWSGTSSNSARNYSPTVRLGLSQQVLRDSAFIFTRTEGLGLPPW